MKPIREQLIALHHSPKLSTRNLQKLLSLQQNYFPENTLVSLLPKLSIPKHNIQEIHETYHQYLQTPLHPNYESNGIITSTLLDENYPSLLKQIADPPNVLFIKGKTSQLEQLQRCIAVVGSRNPSEYGLSVLQYLIPPLIRAGFTIVSGLAKGIDSAAHQITMQMGGQTIAVLGNGINRTYPPENLQLSREIGTHHLLISEYTPKTAPQKWHFPARNRIISGLSIGTLVIEGKAKSGSLITAYCALEQGREVFAVPGQILHENSAGPHVLIKEGAKLVAHPDDILEDITHFI